MTKRIVITCKDGKKPKCRANVPIAEALSEMSYIQAKPHSRVKLMRRTTAKWKLSSLGKRINFVFSALKTACSREFRKVDIDRRQDITA